MATARARLERVRFTDENELNTETTELVRFETSEFPGPHSLIRASGSAVPFLVVESAQISCMQHPDEMHDTEGYDLVGRTMQRTAVLSAHTVRHGIRLFVRCVRLGPRSRPKNEDDPRPPGDVGGTRRKI